MIKTIPQDSGIGDRRRRDPEGEGRGRPEVKIKG